jgi:hypothetical protein
LTRGVPIVNEAAKTAQQAVVFNPRLEPRRRHWTASASDNYLPAPSRP